MNLSKKISISENYIVINYIIDNKYLALAEISKIDAEIFQIFFEDKKDLLKEYLSYKDNIYFFNRLNVPEKLRNQGLGKMLIKDLLTLVNDKNIFLINQANNYNNKSTQKTLENFYEKQGFKKIHEEGLFYYHNELLKINKKIICK